MVNKSRFIRLGLTLIALIMLAGCNNISSSTGQATSNEPRISAEEVRAYCPRVVLPDDSAFYTFYERGGEDDPNRIIYQVAINKTTRACRYGDGQITMEVAAAGRIVPGPKFKPSNVNLSLYVRVQRGNEVIYDKTHPISVAVPEKGQAAQFLFKDEMVRFEQPTERNVAAVIGFNRPKS